MNRPWKWRLYPISVHPASFATKEDRDKDAAKAIADGHQVLIRNPGEDWKPIEGEKRAS